MHSHQIRTLLWLRWRLTVNQLRKGGILNGLLAALLGVVILVLAVGGAVLGGLAGAWGVVKARPLDLLVVYDLLVGVFLFLWMISIVTEIQRSETISIGRLLHLPVSLRGVFAVNYLASHLTLGIILIVPALLGLDVGLALRQGPVMLCLVPLVLAFVFMITAWTYCLRGWLVSLMVNPRRRRAIVAYVTLGAVLLSQLPNLLTHAMRHDSGQTRSAPPAVSTDQGPRLPNAVQLLHEVLPIGWVGYGAMHAAAGNPMPSLLATAGGLAIGALGLYRAYRSTVRFYRGEQAPRQRPRGSPRPGPAAAQAGLAERRLPGVPAEATALAQVFFRGLIRAPEIRIALAMNLLFLVIALAGIMGRRSSPPGEAMRPFVATGAVMVTLFGMLQLMFNHFGHDRQGFRCLVLSPVPRHLILLAKNLAAMPFVLCLGGVLLTAAILLARIGLVTSLATVLQLATAFLLVSMTGNAVSLLAPFRVSPGSLKPTKTRTSTTLAIILSHLVLFPLSMVPVLLGPALGWWLAGPATPASQLINLAVSAILLPAAALAYRVSLMPLGRLLQRREKEILSVVTQEVE
jgi:ABC-2 type transport system permease protein